MCSQYHIGNGVLRDGDDEKGGFMGKNGPHSQYLAPLQNTGIFHMHGLSSTGSWYTIFCLSLLRAVMSRHVPSCPGPQSTHCQQTTHQRTKETGQWEPNTKVCFTCLDVIDVTLGLLGAGIVITYRAFWSGQHFKNRPHEHIVKYTNTQETAAIQWLVKKRQGCAY